MVYYQELKGVENQNQLSSFYWLNRRHTSRQSEEQLHEIRR